MEPDDTNTALRLTDPLAIDLDSLATDLPIATDLRFVQLDVAHLPAGWTVIDHAASTTPPGFERGTYHLLWRLRAPWGDEYIVATGDGTIPELPLADPSSGDDPVVEEVILGDGTPATIDLRRWDIEGNSMIWFDHDGSRVRGTASDGEPGERDTVEHLVALANLPLTTAPTLPYVVLDPHAGPGDRPELAGRIGGVAWGVDVPDQDRAAWGTIAGARSGGIGGIDNTGTDSDGSGLPAATFTVDAVPGYGVVVYGWGSPEATVARLVLIDGRTVDVAMYRRSDAAFFAVPLPLGVAFDRVELLSGDGDGDGHEELLWQSDLDAGIPFGFGDELVWSPVTLPPMGSATTEP